MLDLRSLDRTRACRSDKVKTKSLSSTTCKATIVSASMTILKVVVRDEEGVGEGTGDEERDPPLTEPRME